MQIEVVTLFPELVRVIAEHGIPRRAREAGLVHLGLWNPRDYTHDRHRTVDDRPFGGGPGMLMKVAPLRDAIHAARAAAPQGSPVIALTPQGRRVDQAEVNRLARLPGMVLVCGRYEGMDERVLEMDVDEELSLGDFVLSGGEPAAMALIDAVIRQLPGALGHAESAVQDSFMAGLLDCPHYTRPEVVDGRGVPEVLLSGHHKEIERWRLKQALERTWRRRPELLAVRRMTEGERRLLEGSHEECGIDLCKPTASDESKMR
ncbi:tRNA (guanosine(37)-N1)-methyltransferase TrmD [Thiofaba sp. EF100]|uniref:tRNA (guanosine(37)-N1)-methyltransferase TrmD n=1 Tax=Thiofaba sp. EF100 TaxID=3121274 RepID=UPI003221BFA5